MIFVNFKTYEQGTGAYAIRLAKILEEVSHNAQIKIIPVVQASDVREVAQSSTLEIWVQHIDPVDFGAHTGAVIAEAVFEDGALGTFLNHSEHKFKEFEELEKANKIAKEAGLKTLIFAKDTDELERIIKLSPTLVAYEPQELVGSKTTSVAKARSKVITQAVEIAKASGLPLVVGAGIKSREDVQKSIELGAVGIAVASDVVLAKDPKKEIEDLVSGFISL